MSPTRKVQILTALLVTACSVALYLFTPTGHAHLPDKSVTPDTSDTGINK